MRASIKILSPGKFYNPLWFFLILLITGTHETFSQETYELPRVAPELPVVFIKNVPEIDGIFDTTGEEGWIPVPELNWDQQQVEICARILPRWNSDGLYLAFTLPRASEDELFPTGRTPDAPFTIDVDLDAQLIPDPVGIGRYSLKFIPVTGNVSRMIYRSQPFLMNHRLGAGTKWDDEGTVIWSETTITGIQTEGIMARWTKPDIYRMEIFIPWENLRIQGLPGSHVVYLNVSVSEPGEKRNSLVDGYPLMRGSGIAMKLIPENKDLTGSVIQNFPLIYTPSTLHKQDEKLYTTFDGQALITDSKDKSLYTSLRDPAGRLVASEKPEPGSSGFVLSILETGDLGDGIYMLEICSGTDEEPVSSRPILLAGNIIENKFLKFHELLSRQLDLLASENHEAWISGHLSRAGVLLKESDPHHISSIDDLNLSVELMHECEMVLKSIQAGKRPVSLRENHRDIAGFVADGQRGNVMFIPVQGQKSTLKVQAGKVLDWDVSPLIFGTFSEPVMYDRPVYDLLYAQRLRNSGFEWGHPEVRRTLSDFSRRYRELDSEAVSQILNGEWLPIASLDEEVVAAPWIGIGSGKVKFRIDSLHSENGTCQEVNISGDGDAGIAQVLSLPAWRCNVYNFEVALSAVYKNRDVHVRLYHNGEIIQEALFKDTGNEWTDYRAKFTISKNVSEQNTYLLTITTSRPGTFYIDRATLYPEDNLSGFDPQAIGQFRELNTGWTRWPGGNFASIYNWRQGIGPKAERPSLPNPTWPGLNSNAVGTDEYIRFTELTDQEPLICVNAGTGSPEEAAAWVEYCNGSTDSKNGKLRADYGHQDPFNITYWNIGNELWGSWQWGHCEAGEYADRYIAFKNAMMEKDPTIRLIAVATGAHSQGNPSWTTTLLDKVGKELDILDFHTYVRVPAPGNGYSEDESIRMMLAIPVAYEQFLMEFRKECLIRGLDHVKADIGEYNNNRIPGISEEGQTMVDLLTYAGWLHGFIRQGEYVMGANATEYSVFNPRAGQFGHLHPRNDLFRIYRNEAGSRPLQAQISTPVWQSPNRWGKDVDPIFNIPVIDAVVLEDPADGSIGIGLINRDLEQEQQLEISLEDYSPAGKGIQYLFSTDLDEDLSPGTSSKLMKLEIAVDEIFSVTLPPRSVSLVKIFRKK